MGVEDGRGTLVYLGPSLCPDRARQVAPPGTALRSGEGTFPTTTTAT